MTLYVGTSGWAYKEWKPSFYPQDVPQARFLEHYATVMSACEINATFYRVQAPTTVERWASLTPESFRFTAKSHRVLTYSRSMVPEGEMRALLDDFLGSVGILGPRLGAILMQYPSHRERDDSQLHRLLEALPPGSTYVLEFRHDSWLTPEVEQAVAQAGATVCVSDRTGTVPDALPPGPIAYVRLRHEAYDDVARKGWAELLGHEAKSRDVYVFSKHKGMEPSDPAGGIGLARWLMENAA